MKGEFQNSYGLHNIKPKLDQCAKEVFSPCGWFSYQCSRKNGHGLNGVYCKQHAKRYPAAEVNP